MDMLVRVHVSRTLASEPLEGCKLRGGLFFYGLDIIQWNYVIQLYPGSFPIGPLAEINMDTEAQR